MMSPMPLTSQSSISASRRPRRRGEAWPREAPLSPTRHRRRPCPATKSSRPPLHFTRPAPAAAPAPASSARSPASGGRGVCRAMPAMLINAAEAPPEILVRRLSFAGALCTSAAARLLVTASSPKPRPRPRRRRPAPSLSDRPWLLSLAVISRIVLPIGAASGATMKYDRTGRAATPARRARLSMAKTACSNRAAPTSGRRPAARRRRPVRDSMPTTSRRLLVPPLSDSRRRRSRRAGRDTDGG